MINDCDDVRNGVSPAGGDGNHEYESTILGKGIGALKCHYTETMRSSVLYDEQRKLALPETIDKPLS